MNMRTAVGKTVIVQIAAFVRRVSVVRPRVMVPELPGCRMVRRILGSHHRAHAEGQGGNRKR